MTDKYQVQLGAVQETLFIPLAARARESSRKRPALRDTVTRPPAALRRSCGASLRVAQRRVGDLGERLPVRVIDHAHRFARR